MLKCFTIFFMAIYLTACASMSTPKSEQEFIAKSFKDEIVLDVDWLDAYQRTKEYWGACKASNNQHYVNILHHNVDRDNGRATIKMSGSGELLYFDKMNDNQVRIVYYLFNHPMRITTDNMEKKAMQNTLLKIKDNINNPQITLKKALFC